MLDGLASARLKLIRASEHIKTIKNSIATYAASGPYELIRDANGKEKINIIREPPPEISILSGEVFYQIRSALDHLTFNLVKINPNSIALPTDWEESCSFPLKLTLPKSIQNPPVPYGHDSFSKALPGVAKGPFTFIERLQPYYSSGAHNPWLRRLAKLSNIDRHRHLNLTVTRIRKNELVFFDSGAKRGSWSILNHDTELEAVIGTDYPMGRAVKTDRSFTPIVTFDEPTLPDAAKMPVDFLLDICAYTVETFIAPEFEKFIQKP
jgi:hypothetical protein